jgi:hypothetical protein
VDQLHQTLEGKEGKRRKEKNGGKEEDEGREHFSLSRLIQSIIGIQM